MYYLNYKQTNKYLYILSEAIEVTIGDTYFSSLIIQWVLTLRQQNLSILLVFDFIIGDPADFASAKSWYLVLPVIAHEAPQH
jgi:hypothetical protein